MTRNNLGLIETCGQKRGNGRSMTPDLPESKRIKQLESTPQRPLGAKLAIWKMGAR
jgi:hypothetical protein